MSSAIPIREHEANLDRTSVLVFASRDVRADVFKCAGGYVATVGDGMCLTGFFPTLGQAQEAIKTFR
jgi:hypothetical protein